MRMCELLATLEGAVYLERVALNTIANINKAKKAVRRAFDVQEKKLGFSFVEFVSSCPTNWGLTPIAALDFIAEKMIPAYPLGVYREPEGEN